MEKTNKQSQKKERKKTDHNTQKRGRRMPPNEMATQPTASTKISFIFFWIKSNDDDDDNEDEE